MEERMIKYPRTPHIEGSRLGVGDEDIPRVAFEKIRGVQLALEEKVDGANSGISFSEDGRLLLQSRGHFLRGGGREEQFALFKLWASSKQSELYSILGSRYIMYGEWMYAKHAIFYDALPHYFMEFDIYDKRERVFLDTDTRRKMLAESSIVSAPTLYQGRLSSIDELLSYIGPSPFISEYAGQRLRDELISLGLSPDSPAYQAPRDNLIEGIYIKLEAGGEVIDRMKYVRGGFTQVQLNEERSRVIVKNLLKEGVSLF